MEVLPSKVAEQCVCEAVGLTLDWTQPATLKNFSSFLNPPSQTAPV
jgi:hypothetical protein